MEMDDLRAFSFPKSIHLTVHWPGDGVLAADAVDAFIGEDHGGTHREALDLVDVSTQTDRQLIAIE